MIRQYKLVYSLKIYMSKHFSDAVNKKMLYHHFSTLPISSHMYEGGPKNNRNRPVAHACFLVTSCAAR
jgi:hypothetical protein